MLKCVFFIQLVELRPEIGKAGRDTQHFNVTAARIAYHRNKWWGHAERVEESRIASRVLN